MGVRFQSFVAELFSKAIHVDVDIWTTENEVVVMIGKSCRRFKIGSSENWGPIEDGQMDLRIVDENG